MDLKKEFMDIYADRLVKSIDWIVRSWGFVKRGTYGGAWDLLTRAQAELQVLRGALALMESKDEEAALDAISMK
ncbi:MAG: hypothetical protein DRH24_17680 [Deltaproteobacteria bacterium]|nr:MAG: hypothetical protein DRH24_17680 [Deltaproteobacteria bacterium]